MLLYVDKTGFIKTVVESAGQVQLITRPRWLDKTLFMDMLNRDKRCTACLDRLRCGRKFTHGMAFCRNDCAISGGIVQ